MSLREAASLDAFSEGFEGRLSALSKVHSMVIASDGGESLHSISKLILAPYNSNFRSPVKIDGPEVAVISEAVIPLAMCMHEIATNAAKYGALSSPNGRVSWTWGSVDQNEKISLIWRETGGSEVAPPTSERYGSRFSRSAARRLHGNVKLSYETTGLTVRFELPASIVNDQEPL